jgi:tetratricopeptide (TPR) repeat protein
LDWQLYFYRGLAEVAVNKTPDALGDFRRARFLVPIAYELPVAEGNAWLSSQPILAATAWRDALRKAGPHRPEVFASMLTNATLRNPEVGHILQEVGLSQPDLALSYLGRLQGEPFRQGVDLLLKTDPKLDTLGETQKLAFFDLWSEHGDLNDLSLQIQRHPEWLNYAWLGMAKYKASKSDFHGAYDLTQRFGDAVALPRTSADASLEDLQKRYSTNPDNYGVGYALYLAQVRQGRIDDALNIARHFSERSNSPAYFHFLEARCWAAKQNWERAWTAWLAYRKAAKK